MMRKSVVHKEKYSNKREISQTHSDDGTAARTRPFSFDEIMIRRKNKKQSERFEEKQLGSEVVYGKRAEGVSDRVEADRHKHRHRDDGGGREEHASKETLKVSSRTKEDKAKLKAREEKIVEDECKESNDAHRRSKISSSDNAKDRRKEREVHEKRKNQDRPNDGFDNETRKRHNKDSSVKERDKNMERNRDKSEHVTKRKTPNGLDERSREHGSEKKHESRKWHDSDTSDRKLKKGTSESHSRHEDLKSRSKRSRSREHERDKRRSNSPSPKGHKQRLYDVREHEELSLHSSKDKPQRFDSNIDKKRVSNNGSSNNKSKRHDTSASRLGGYSPRKRRSEAAIKTPSPTSRSPEKKKIGWDSPPVKTEPNVPTSFQSDLLALNKTDISNRHEVPTVIPIASSIPKPTFGVLSSFPLIMNASVDSVQLTQATRPKRRIYVENLPSSASESAVMEWLTGYLRPYGVNHIQSTSPCISCIVNKEKGQALVEFLTPEDASTALSLDGKSFLGNILKIRRPKDYVETSTGVLEKPVAGAVSIKNDVQDSPNKIFVGGISKVITSEMLVEIATAFGPLKAYHFEANTDHDTSSAFIEYADQSVTIKACVGLNGMKLGGKVLTVTQAIPDASSVENHGDLPFYGTPVHAQPLLEKPTQVLKLNNVVDPHSLSSLSEQELEEMVEDVRLECARFGMVKSINIVKQTNVPRSPETIKVTERESEPLGSDNEHHEQIEKPEDGNNCYDAEKDESAPREPEKVNGSKSVNTIVKDEPHDTPMADGGVENQISLEIDELELNDNKSMNLAEPDRRADDVAADVNDNTFETGCVLVEFKRTEASSMAAHCLHGRVFDGRSVSVKYVAHDVYCARFHK